MAFARRGEGVVRGGGSVERGIGVGVVDVFAGGEVAPGPEAHGSEQTPIVSQDGDAGEAVQAGGTQPERRRQETGRDPPEVQLGWAIGRSCNTAFRWLPERARGELLSRLEKMDTLVKCLRVVLAMKLAHL